MAETSNFPSIKVSSASRNLCVAVAASCIWLPAPAGAINCETAATDTEKTICASPDLLGQDKALNAAFSRAIGRLGKKERSHLRASQRRWLGEVVEVCKAKVECLAEAFAARRKILLPTPRYGRNPGSELLLRTRTVIGENNPDAYVDNDAVMFASACEPFEKLWNNLAVEVLRRDERPFKDGYSSASLSLVHASATMLSGVMGSGFGSPKMAHGNWDEEAVNIHVPDEAPAKFEEVFRPGSEDELVKICIKPPEDESPQEEWDAQALSALRGRVKNMKAWLFKPDGADLLLPPYSLGGYAQPSYGCSFIAKELAALAKPTFELWRLSFGEAALDL